MFSGREDKINLKEASLTQIQGFPENAANKSIYEIVHDLKAQDARKKRPQPQSVDLTTVRRNELSSETQRTSIANIKHTESVDSKR